MNLLMFKFISKTMTNCCIPLQLVKTAFGIQLIIMFTGLDLTLSTKPTNQIPSNDGWIPNNGKPQIGDDELVECQTTNVPLNTQVGGNHYKNFKIQPAEFSEKNGLSFCEGNVIKYIARKKDNRLEDLKKARHYIDMLIQFEEEKRDV